MDAEQELEDFADAVEHGEARQPARRGKARINVKRRRYGELDDGEEGPEDSNSEVRAGGSSSGQCASRCISHCPPTPLSQLPFRRRGAEAAAANFHVCA